MFKKLFVVFGLLIGLAVVGTLVKRHPELIGQVGQQVSRVAGPSSSTNKRGQEAPAAQESFVGRTHDALVHKSAERYKRDDP